MEYVNFARSMVDFGLVVLIWIVQLIVYPGFHVINPVSFNNWHRKYMVLITFVVAPLMFAQLFLTGIRLWTNPGILSAAGMVFVVLVWLHTFFKAVPLHNALTRDGNQPQIVDTLVKANWFRTITWSLIWVLSLTEWWQGTIQP